MSITFIIYYYGLVTPIAYFMAYANILISKLKGFVSDVERVNTPHSGSDVANGSVESSNEDHTPIKPAAVIGLIQITEFIVLPYLIGDGDEGVKPKMAVAFMREEDADLFSLNVMLAAIENCILFVNTNQSLQITSDYIKHVCNVTGDGDIINTSDAYGICDFTSYDNKDMFEAAAISCTHFMVQESVNNIFEESYSNSDNYVRLSEIVPQEWIDLYNKHYDEPTKPTNVN